jgi:small subunit ribosomal protein S18
MLRKRRKKARQRAEISRANRVNIEELDYKDVALLQRFVTAQGKMFSRKRSGLDAHAQRVLSLAIKRARFLALMPYVS